jgi:hypothetical protein
MEYKPEDIQQGMERKLKAEENPTSFPTIAGAREKTDPKSNDKTRMAGERVMQLMRDPVESQRTMNWMTQFNLSNEGVQFNQGKMMMANPQLQQEQQ